MYHSKPIQILRTLSGPELRRFGEFLESPVFNRQQAPREALALLRPFHPRYDQPEIDRKALFKALFPGETWDEKKLRYLWSDLAKLLEDFLVWNAFREQEGFYREHLLMRSYKDRRLDKYFSSTLTRVQRLLNEHPYRDVRYHLMSFTLEEDIFQFNSSRKSHQSRTNLQEVVDELDVYYLSNKLKYTCEILNNRDVVHVDYKLFLLQEVRKHLEDRDLERHPAIAVYHQIFRTLTEPEQHEHYRRLIELLEAHRDQFPPQEVFDMYVYAKNYCIIKINTGHVEYNRELLDFYRTILDAGIIFKDGNLTQWDYKNIVTLGLRLEDFDWTEGFMNEFKGALREAVRENVWSYNMANLEFHKANYDGTLELLQAVDFTDVYYYLDSKTLLMKTYYEMEAWDPLMSVVDTVKAYLKRKKVIPTYQRTVYGNLIQYLSRLVRFRRGRKLDLDGLLSEIDEVKEIANIVWLRSKIAELLEARAARTTR